LQVVRPSRIRACAVESSEPAFLVGAGVIRSIGKTGILAMRPFLHMTRKDLWQLYVLEK